MREHPPDGVLFKIVDDMKPDIREWAHGERDPFRDKPGDEFFVLEAAVAMVDAFDVQFAKLTPIDALLTAPESMCR